MQWTQNNWYPIQQEIFQALWIPFHCETVKSGLHLASEKILCEKIFLKKISALDYWDMKWLETVCKPFGPTKSRLASCNSDDFGKRQSIQTSYVPNGASIKTIELVEEIWNQTISAFYSRIQLLNFSLKGNERFFQKWFVEFPFSDLSTNSMILSIWYSLVTFYGR